uniref:Uncharacterized protein n=1 Tax=Rhizophora mucronata TaxID=61149 RepID=A0A2P2LZ69_RHIMU
MAENLGFKIKIKETILPFTSHLLASCHYSSQCNGEQKGTSK